MFSQTTRLEFIIVAVALLVLLLCSQPPKSGNADISMDTTEPRSRETSENAPETQYFEPEIPEPPAQSLTNTNVFESKTDTPAAGRDDGESLRPQVQPQAQPSDSANAAEDVAVRYVWDGTRLVPQKVRIVDEGNGVRSVWSYDR
jgi:hypothetical protein